jgi:uncharacterized protein (DUF362 family)
MKLNPLLQDENAVLISRTPVPQDPDRADFNRAADHVLAALQLTIEPGENVVFKPNLTTVELRGDPDSGIGTRPDFVRGLIDHVLAHGVAHDRIYVLEDPRDQDDDLPRLWKGTHFPEISAETGARLRCPNTHSVVKRTVPQPLKHPVRRVSRLAVAPDTVLINVPKMKTHTWAITTLSIKNLMGVDLVFDRHYCGQSLNELPEVRTHEDKPKEEWMTTALHQQMQKLLGARLADLNQVVRPELNIVEGVVGRDGTGFNRGRNFGLGLSIAGTNTVAVDAVTSYLMGFDPAKLIYLQMAASVGLGTYDLGRIKVYVAEGGQVQPCHDLAAQRCNPRFEVLTELLDEDAETYR